MRSLLTSKTFAKTSAATLQLACRSAHLQRVVFSDKHDIVLRSQPAQLFCAAHPRYATADDHTAQWLAAVCRLLVARHPEACLRLCREQE